MLRSALLLVVFALSLSVPEMTHAYPITFTFTGNVIQTNKPDAFALGQSLIGSYTFDSDTPLYHTNGEQSIYRGIEGMTIASGSYFASATPANSANQGGDILVNRDTGIYDPQMYEVFLQRSPDQDLWGPDIDGYELERMDLRLTDDVDHAITSLDLPLVPPDLSAFTSKTFGLIFSSDATDSPGVMFSITSLTVPEPSAMLLVVVALGLAVAAPSRS